MSSKLDLKLFPTPQHKTDFQNGVKKILKYHRIITGAPGLTCSISINPFLSNLLSIPPSSMSNSPFQQQPQPLPIINLTHSLISTSVGYSDLHSMTKMNPNNTMMIASITKFATSILVGRLIEQGVMTFHDIHRPIAEIFMECQGKLMNGMDINNNNKNNTNSNTNNNNISNFSNFSNFSETVNEKTNFWLHNLKIYNEMKRGQDVMERWGSGSTAAPFMLDPMLIKQMEHVMEKFDQFNNSLNNNYSNSLNNNNTSNNNIQSNNETLSPTVLFTELIPKSFFEITLGQLLSHTAGIRDYNCNLNEDCCDINYPNVFTAIQQFIWDPLLDNEIFPKNPKSEISSTSTISTSKVQHNDSEQSIFVPKRRKFVYTTFGYCLVQAVIECLYFNYSQRCNSQNDSFVDSNHNHNNKNINNTNNHNNSSTPRPLQRPRAHPPHYIPQSLSFQSIVQIYLTQPLNLPDLHHEMIRPLSTLSALSTSSPNSHRCTEYTRGLFPRYIVLPPSSPTSTTTQTPSTTQSPSQHPPTSPLIPMLSPTPSSTPPTSSPPTSIPTNSNKTIKPIIMNKSNIGGCMVSNAPTLATLGCLVLQSYLPPHLKVGITNLHRQYHQSQLQQSLFSSSSSSACVDFVSREWLQYMHQYHYLYTNSGYPTHPSSPQTSTTTTTPSFSFGAPITTPPSPIYPIVPQHTIQTHNYPSALSYGLGCINFHNTSSSSLVTSPTNHHHLLSTSNSLNTPAAYLTLNNPIIYHTGQGVGSSGVLLLSPLDGLSISVLANVGHIDLKELGADLAILVKNWIQQILNQHTTSNIFEASL